MVNDEQDTVDGMPKNEKKLRTREPTVLSTYVCALVVSKTIL